MWNPDGHEQTLTEGEGAGQARQGDRPPQA